MIHPVAEPPNDFHGAHNRIYIYDLTPGFDSSDCGDIEINCVMAALSLGFVRSFSTLLYFLLLLALNHETVFIDYLLLCGEWLLPLRHIACKINPVVIEIE
jgi:hypothetical protein